VRRPCSSSIPALLDEHPDPRLLPQHAVAAHLRTARTRTARLRTARPRFPLPPVPPSPSACPLRRFCNGSSLRIERFPTERARSTSRSAYEVGFAPAARRAPSFAPAPCFSLTWLLFNAMHPLVPLSSKRRTRRPVRANEERRRRAANRSERRARAQASRGARPQRLGVALSLSLSLSLSFSLVSCSADLPLQSRVQESASSKPFSPHRHCFEPDESLSCPTSL